MKAPLNTDNWSGSIKSDKAPLNTDDWNGFISADMSRKLSQNCQCIKAPCNCGVIQNVPTLPPKTSELSYEEAKERAKEFSYFKNPKRLFDKLTANPIIIGIVLVAGYFAYQKFKK
jgi:hypothetical protein